MEQQEQQENNKVILAPNNVKSIYYKLKSEFENIKELDETEYLVGSIQMDNEVYEIEHMDDLKELIDLHGKIAIYTHTYNRSIELLELPDNLKAELPPCTVDKIDEYSPQDVMHDITLRIKILATAKLKATLADSIEKLDVYLSEEDKYERDINEISQKLGIDVQELIKT